MRKAVLWVLLLVLLPALSGCTALDGLSHSAVLPDLHLLERPAYEEPSIPLEADEPADSALIMDLWLDASQVMGGINPNEQSMYPHASRKYREGGFHYRYQNDTGMYETVLRCMLSGVEGSRVRLLRYGNERLPDDYLVSQGVVSADASVQELRSVRRDMLTFAIDPMPAVFSSFSGEKMTDSFYSPGTPMLNQIGALPSGLLENPSLADAMSRALDQQIRLIAKSEADSLMAVASEQDYPLLYALDNLDLNRLSVITCDPAAIRRLTAVDSSGSPAALVEKRMRERGVFDAGLSVQLYAFTLDYMGQLSSFASADLSEPLLWGRLHYSNKTGRDEGILVMPRTLLTLVVGSSAQVETFTAAFEQQLSASDTLKVPRGPQNGELTYTANGQTVVQEPFGFDYESTLIRRGQVDCLTQHTAGAALTAGDADVSTEGTLTTVTLSPVDGAQPDRTLTLVLPLAQAPGGMALDADELTNLQLSVQSALLLSDVLTNSPDASIPENAQTIALRDKLYVFTPQQPLSPVRCAGLHADGRNLTVDLPVDGAQLQPGYYRLLLSADLPGESMAWQTPEWVSRLNATITNEQVSAWEAFSEVLSKYERKRNYISRPYQHAWGDADNTTYYDTPVPEFPPVTLAPGLAELVRQLQNAAHPGAAPYVRYMFDLFVTY